MATRFGSATQYAWGLIVSRLKASATLASKFLGGATLDPEYRAEAEELLRRGHRLSADWHSFARRVEAGASPRDERAAEEFCLRGAA